MAYCANGCKATEKTTETRVETNNSSISYVLPSSNELEISNLCDSITGKPIDFKSKIETSTGDINLESKDNKLRFIYKTDTIIKDSIVFKEVLVDNRETIIEYRTPKLIWYILIGLVVVVIAFIMFPIIPKFINSAIRRLIAGV